MSLCSADAISNLSASMRAASARALSGKTSGASIATRGRARVETNTLPRPARKVATSARSPPPRTPIPTASDALTPCWRACTTHCCQGAGSRITTSLLAPNCSVLSSRHTGGRSGSRRSMPPILRPLCGYDLLVHRNRGAQRPGESRSGSLRRVRARPAPARHRPRRVPPRPAAAPGPRPSRRARAPHRVRGRQAAR